MTPLFISIIGGYFILMMFIGYLSSRQVKTLEDYLVAGRRLPFFLAMPTLVATWYGAGSCMGVSGTVYSQGFYGVLADPFGCSLALIIAGLFFAAPFHKLRLLTMADLLRNTYGARFERVATLITLPFYIGTLASQMIAMGYIFQIVSGISPEWGILLSSLIVVIYTVSGGMWAVTLTDFVQLALIIVGLLLLLPLCFDRVGDHTALFAQFAGEFSTLLPKGGNGEWLAYIGRITMTGLGAIMGQDLLQRSIASRSPSVARSSALVGGGVYLLLGLIPLLIGLAGREIFPALDQPEQLIPLLAREFLSPLSFAIFACGLLSAIMSTADSYLLAGTSLLTHNIFLRMWKIETERSKLILVRCTNLLIVLISLALAFSGTSIFDLMVHSGATLFVAILVPTSAALFWRGANTPAAWGGLIVGTLSWASWIIYCHADLSLQHENVLFSAATVGGSLSLLAYLVVSVFAHKTQKIYAT